MAKFQTEWWQCNIPEDWDSDYNEGCATFTSKEGGVGALQISEYRREDRDVTDGDLRNFAAEHIGAGANLTSISCGDFSGFHVFYRTEEKSFWCEYWLRLGQVMIYVTYNCAISDKDIEISVVKGILESLAQSEIENSKTPNKMQ